jgi:methylated-DNA-[protein]-cysteine S-methyltransferase
MSANVYYCISESPVGDLLLRTNGTALTGVFLDVDRAPRVGSDWRRDAAGLRPFRAQLQAYFGGELQSFDLPLAMNGTPFQQTVWSALRNIPYGATISYGELARRIGKPKASRAVGLANGSNPLSIVVPCHRVIGADGSLTGYGGGLERKRWLLRHERAPFRDQAE